jgi:hypothetical protein
MSPRCRILILGETVVLLGAGGLDCGKGSVVVGELSASGAEGFFFEVADTNFRARLAKLLFDRVHLRL